MDEEIFRALADPSRRALLDALRERDGQALSELETALPGMTRFGVMKHLRVLAGASLLTTRRRPGRPPHAPLPPPRPDPPRLRPLGEQVHRALGSRLDRSQTNTGGTDGEGL